MKSGRITLKNIGTHDSVPICVICGSTCKKDEFYWDEMTRTIVVEDVMCKDCCKDYEYDSEEDCYRRRQDPAILWKHNTPLHACVIETLKPFNEILRADTNHIYFICGLYELQEGTNMRSGSIVIYRYSRCATSNKDLCFVITTINCSSGVLDMKISDNLLFVALSEGSLCSYKLEAKKGEGLYDDIFLSLEYVKSHSIADEGMFLSLSVVKTDSATHRVFISTQAGSAIVCDYSLNDKINVGASAVEMATIVLVAHIEKMHVFLGESTAAWIIFADSKNPSRFATGGDDCTLRLWDIDHSIEKNVYASKKGDFKAGVTSGQFQPSSDKFVVGSYDENISIYRGFGANCVRLVKIEAGGGIWRTKWFTKSYDEDYVVSANMFGGASIFSLTKTGSEKENKDIVYDFDRVYTFKDCNTETSLAYGVDVLHHEAHEGKNDVLVMAICTFYDNKVIIVRSDFP